MEQIQRYFARFDETFFVFCDKELLKINTFFSGKLCLLTVLASQDKTIFAIDSHLTSFALQISEKLSEASRKMANLQSELSASQQAENRQKMNTSPPPTTSGGSMRRRRSSLQATLLKDKDTKQQQMTIRKIHDIKLAFSEFYLSLILLQNYQTLNFTGFRKILKKHDKVRTGLQNKCKIIFRCNTTFVELNCNILKASVLYLAAVGN